ncbi:type IV toxin-antitoxin system AbiEi family antitoxin domain-containing protein [Nocardioides exalbidus]|nr:type IV toxin-antitoxin system AbiEi family antitoxin domain-containing protein [Nocardioides exalbidus]
MTEPQVDLEGLVRLRRDLLASGITDNQIDRLVRAKVLKRIRYGAYVQHDVWDRLTPEDRHRLLARAVRARAHSATALTHVSSIVERGIPLWGFSLDVVHTTRTGNHRAGRRQADWTPHRGILEPEDQEELNGVVISTAARSAFEVTTIGGVEAALVAVNRLLHAKAMTLDEFVAQAEAHREWPGSLTTNLVMHLADHRLESVGEDRFSFLAHTQGLVRPEPQVDVFDEQGTLVARVDFAWPELNVFVEFDGKIKYAKHRREGETLDEFLMREKKREVLVCQLTGWTCIRITWSDLARPELLATRIRKVMASRNKGAA